jgi:SET domain-containing protein
MEVPPMLEMKPSNVHGIGVFACQKIVKGTCLGPFIGEPMTHKEFKEKYGKNRRYCYWVPFGWMKILVAKEKRNWITYVNEHKEPNVHLKKYNCYACKDIEAGEELFLYYGRVYPRDYTL